ncbi:MAG: potassium channel family protein [Solirubrobacteraceae bacterium]
MDDVPAGSEAVVEDGAERRGEAPKSRYAAVLLVMLIAVIFLIAVPTTDLTKAIGIGLEGVALVITVATSRARETIRIRRAVGLIAGLIAVMILIAVGDMPRSVLAAIAVVLTVAIPIALVRGLVRLLRREGVTLLAVAGSLAIYLSIGLVFAWAIGFVAEVIKPTPYFAQGTNGTLGEKVYFSFTSLTTTGFGDFSPGTPTGHAIAVIEMLTGQLYLVTVIGLLIGNFARGAAPEARAAGLDTRRRE